jgi:hypothetical protein
LLQERLALGVGANLDPCGLRHKALSLLQQLYGQCAEASNGEQVSRPRPLRPPAIARLCEELIATKTVYPGTTLTLVLRIKPARRLRIDDHSIQEVWILTH